MEKKNGSITLTSLREHEKEKFITDIQAAFKKAAMEEFGDSDDEVISKKEVDVAAPNFCQRFSK